MTAQQTLLADTAEGVFAALGPSATVAADWPTVAELGLTTLLKAEVEGGFGGSWRDALIVFRLAGRHAVALPVVEAVLAAKLAPAAEAFGTVATAAVGRITQSRFTGELAHVPWGRDAGFVVAAVGGEVVRLGPADAVKPGVNPAGEPRDRLIYRNAPATRLEPADLFAIGALARVGQIAGALEAALACSVQYVNTRQQFGRPLAKFQALQHALAGFAGEVAAANCAAVHAFQAADRGEAAYEIAAAKLRANMAVGVGTAVAHQVHGGIGFTREYALHPLTRRLWGWRSEFGADQHWASRLGGQVAARGAELFWSDMAARTDPPDVEP